VIGHSVLRGLLDAKAVIVVGFRKEGWQPHAKAKSEAGLLRVSCTGDSIVAWITTNTTIASRTRWLCSAGTFFIFKRKGFPSCTNKMIVSTSSTCCTKWTSSRTYDLVPSCLWSGTIVVILHL
jgi:hypothetical protein